MLVCNNCGSQLGCECQVTYASSGKKCCVFCIGKENQQEVILNQQKEQMQNVVNQSLNNINSLLMTRPQ